MAATEHPVRKRDAGKPRPELVDPALVDRMGEVLEHGARKYADWDWWAGTFWGRYYGAALRHLNAWWAGEDLDPESGLSHLGHAACCLMILASYEERAVGVDDRPRRERRRGR